MSSTKVNFFINYVPSPKTIKNNKVLNNKYSDKRKFFGCGKQYHYVGYVDRGSKERLDYVEYSGDAEKSSGVFNQKGLLDEDAKKKLQRSLSKTKSPIWHGLVSFEELFGKEYCDNYEQAYDLMKKELPKFLKNAGFKIDNIEWFAGLHTNTDNRHIHFSFYEKKPLNITEKKSKRYSLGKVDMFSINKTKLNMELTLKEIYNLHNERDDALGIGKKVLSNYGLDSLIYKRLKLLNNTLPKEGRLSYDSQNLKYHKSFIDEVAVDVIKNNADLSRSYQEYLNLIVSKDNELKDICTRNKIDFKKFSLEEKYVLDFKRRFGNLVLKTLKEFEADERQVQSIKYSRLVEKRIQKGKRKKLFKSAKFLREQVERESFYYLKQLLQKLEQIELENYIYEEDFEL